MIYSGKNEANCTLRVTIAGITESKYYLTSYGLSLTSWQRQCKSLQTVTSDSLPSPWVAEVVAQGSWQAGPGLLCHAVATLHLANANGSEEFF